MSRSFLLLLATLIGLPFTSCDMFAAVRANDLEKLKDLLKMCPACVNEKGRHGGTPLLHAVGQGRTSVVKFLLKKVRPRAWFVHTHVYAWLQSLCARVMSGARARARARAHV